MESSFLLGTHPGCGSRRFAVALLVVFFLLAVQRMPQPAQACVDCATNGNPSGCCTADDRLWCQNTANGCNLHGACRYQPRRCDCLSGWDRPYCATETNECSSSPCQNGGMCSDLFDAYSCSCAPGYYGTSCQYAYQCPGTSPCQNGGTCSEGSMGTYTCACDTGFTGTNCDAIIDLCTAVTCLNGGICSPAPNSVLCDCGSSGCSGVFCDDCQSGSSETGLPTMSIAIGAGILVFVCGVFIYYQGRKDMMKQMAERRVGHRRRRSSGEMSGLSSLTSSSGESTISDDGSSVYSDGVSSNESSLPDVQSAEGSLQSYRTESS